MKRACGSFARRGAPVVLLLLTATAVPSFAADPPLLYLDVARATGHVVDVPNGTLHSVTIDLVDSLGYGPSCCDTVPGDSEIRFEWHAVAQPGGSITGYQIPGTGGFETVDPTVTSVVYERGTLGSGPRLFFVRVLTSNGLTTEVDRWFHLGIAPDSWFSGPDPAAAPGGSVALGDVASLGGLFGCDSLTVRPGERPARKTFTEIYGDRAWVRSEGDTVHMNSWVVLHWGGSDSDSPYGAAIGPGSPALLDTLACPSPAAVVDSAGLIGSAVTFRFIYGFRLDPAGPFGIPAGSPLLPNFDPATANYAPTIAGYRAFNRSSRVYLLVASQDGNGVRDYRIGTAPVARNIVDHVEAGTASPEEIALRHLILTFYVNRSPYLLAGDPAFVPRPGQAFVTRSLDLNLLAHDEDPYQPATPAPPPGGPTPTGVLRRNVWLRGFDMDGHEVRVAALSSPVFDPLVHIVVPDEIIGPDVTVEVELCDCAECDLLPGSGRCVTTEFQVQIPPSAPTPVLASLVEAHAVADHVRLRWSLARSGEATVERRSMASDWQALASLGTRGGVEITYEDDDVEPGARYGYRLRLETDAGTAVAGETWVDVPVRARLALEGVRPNPATSSAFTVHFTLAGDAPARMELIDLSGRRVASRDLGAPGAGAHTLVFGAGRRVPPGVYLLRLEQDGEARVRRITVLD